MSEQPLVSVLTPTYNNGEYLAECIESVLKQTYTNFEYIVVNNCSKDDTLAIAQSYAAKDPRVRVHNNSEFLGVIANHNHAFRMISPASKYTKVVSGDDWIYPDCLKLMVELAEAHPSVGLVGSYSIAGKQVLWEGLDYEQKVVNGRDISRATLLGGPYVFGSPTTLLYRSDLLRRTPEFYPGTNPHADTTACYESLKDTDFGFVHQVLSYTRVHTETQTSSSRKFGIINRAMIGDVLRFGPHYLSEAELKQQREVFTDKYYNWLVPALVENSFDKEFLDKQKSGLAEIGLELSAARIAKAALMRGIEFLQTPASTGKKILQMAKRRGKLEARYY
jgi:glycosyltransferase involved in cell wall biosynthesis